MPRTRWDTDQPCPSCGAGMVLTDDGLPVLRAECPACGHADHWDTPGDEASGGDDW